MLSWKDGGAGSSLDSLVPVSFLVCGLGMRRLCQHKIEHNRYAKALSINASIIGACSGILEPQHPV